MAVITHTTVGRDTELIALTEALGQLAVGRGCCVWIEGDAGIGKSHLIAQLVDRAADYSHPVLVGHAEQLMRTFPLRGAADALGITSRSEDPARSVVAGLLGGEPVDGVSYADPVLAAAERMLDIIERMCADRPLVLVLEDVQWADDASLSLLDRLSGEIDQIPLLLVLTARRGTPDPDGAREAIARRAAHRLGLGPLSAAQVRVLAEARFGADLGPRLAALLDTAAGSPLYVHEILDLLGREDLRTLSGGRAELASDAPIPGRLAEALGRRLDSLDPGHLQAIRLAALFGGSFAVNDLALVLARDPEPALRCAAASGIVDLADGRARFRHELIRQVLTGELPEAVRSGMHDHVARILAAEARPDNVVAGHLLAAADPLAGWALRWLADRPEATLYTAPDAYAALLTRAASVPTAEQLHAVLVQRLMLVSFWLGRDDQVIALGQEAITGAADDPDLAARLRIQVMRSLARQRRFDEAVQMAAPSAQDPAASPLWRARAAAWMANAQAFLGEPDKARAVARSALELATATGDSLGMSYAHAALVAVDGAEHVVGHLEAALDVLGDEPEAQDQRVIVAGNLAARLGSLGDPRIEPMLEEFLATAERIGTYRTSVLHAHAAQYFYEHGRWDEALLHITQLGQPALRHPAFVYLLGMRAVIAYRRADLEEGDRTLGEAGLPEPGQGADFYPSTPLLIEAAALRAESAGRLDQALAIRSHYLELPVSVQRDSRSHEALYLIRLARALGAVDLAQAAVTAVADVAASPTLDTRLTIAACQAVVRADAAGLGGIAEDFLAGGWSPYAAYAFEEAAAAWAEAGDVTAARTGFLRATDIYDEHGAAWDVRRATARFRPHGLRRAARAPARETRTGWAALTAAELRIGKLVAQGYSNPDIARELMISRNTVQTHVSNMLAKLGRHSRTELAREVVLRMAEPAPGAAVTERGAL
jgi:DNA-binding CsgD family transcriptional regulator